MNILKHIFSIEKDATHTVFHLLGIRLRCPKYGYLVSLIAETVSKEVYKAIEVSSLHSKTFSQFENCNREDNITIVGCGPTLKYYNNEADFKNIALNKALFLDNIHFDYTFCFDGAIQKTCPGYLEKLKDKDCVKFIGNFINTEYPTQMPVINDDTQKIYRYFSARRHGYTSMNDFEYIIHQNISVYPLTDFYSISFAALQFALYTYPKKIYLVGLDTDAGKSQNFFDGKSIYNTKKMIEGYYKFKEFAQRYYPETEIISINPVGLRGLFKDVYTESYLAEHPELRNEKVEVIKNVGR